MRKFYNFGINGKGVYIDDNDLLLIWYLFQQRLLTSKQLHQFANAHNTISYNTFRNKIWRWEKYDIVVSKNLTSKKRFGNEFNLYRIGKKGFYILRQHTKLDNEDVSEKLSSYFHMTNYDHHFATQQMALEMYLAFKKEGLNISVMRPAKFRDGIKLDQVNFLPDALLFKKREIVFVETDLATESISQLKEKVENYLTLAQILPTFKFYVVFGLIDDSFPTQRIFTNNGFKRLGNMKNIFMVRNDIHIGNIDFYVTHMKRTRAIAYNISQKIKSKKNDEVKVAINVLQNLNKKFNYSFHALDNSKVYMHDMQDYLFGDKVLKLKHKADKAEVNVIVIKIEEGNTKDLDKLYFLEHVMTNMLLKIHISKIIAVYSTKEQLMNDYIPYTWKNVLFVANSELITHFQEEPAFYVLNKSKSKVKFKNQGGELFV
ncbi:replication-relaxation family protein [Gracilibacillus massiliensis]|uniref:replication-relaxation family protein n=1 Tax=Gracilibacillus massiliensis TaxID=1564956 RepID=UPI00071CAD13|nr:replication-relaxation family protein [Gracilibacillus massiliensis]